MVSINFPNNVAIFSFIRIQKSHLWLQVLLGRATEDIKVDIDLGREGLDTKISQQQVISA